MPGKTLQDLNQMYDNGTSTDKSLYAEMRSNLLLIKGDHYNSNRGNGQQYSRLRESNKLTAPAKLRITKNEIHRVHRMYTEAIISKAPGVTVLPANESEMQDQKNAEQNKALIDHVDRTHNMRAVIRDWAEEYTGIGEVATKIFWSHTEGKFRGYEQKVDADGNPIFLTPEGEETLEPGIPADPGQEYVAPSAGDPFLGIEPNGEVLAREPTEAVEFEPAPDESLPIFAGGLVFEPLFGFNIWRQPGTERMQDSPYIGLRKMTEISTLKERYKDDKEKLKFILESSSDSGFIVFDATRAGYQKDKTHTLLREVYYRPSPKYPEGYYYVWTEFGILEEGKLPFGMFPIKWAAFDRLPSAPRGHSIIKVARPFQAEINRASSQRATHGITLADDKILYQAGTKLAPGGLLPGVRGVTYQGQVPTILPGRNGEQFSAYIKDERMDLYSAVMLGEETAESQQNLDPYTLLFRTMGQQSKYKKYVERFEEFLIEVYEHVLELLREYLPDEDLAQILGPKDAVNLNEFRTQVEQNYRIKLAPQSDSIDTMMGKQLTFNQILQYSGSQMQGRDVGQLIRAMPFVNGDEMFGDMTIDYDNVKNDMLAIERGEQPQLSPYANNEYLISKLTHRMKQPDFRFLPPQIQQMYQQYLQQNEQEVQRKIEARKKQESDLIPVGGAMITLGMRMPGDGGKGKTEQVRLPYQSLMHLMKQLESQGDTVQTLENMNSGALAEMGQQAEKSMQTTADQQEPENRSIMRNGYAN